MRWALVLVCGCRLGFDGTTPDARAGDSSSIDAALVDTPPGLTSITFGERATSERKNVTADTTLESQQPTQNNGGGEDLGLAEDTGRARSLVRFDLSSIPPGTPVVAAQLRLVKLDYGDEMAGGISVKLVAESWVEGTGDGTVEAGTATWSTRDGTNAWLTPGGTVSATLAMLTPPAASFEIALPVATVQSWIDAPQLNFGVQLVVDAAPTHYHFHQANAPTVEARPELALLVAD